MAPGAKPEANSDHPNLSFLYVGADSDLDRRIVAQAGLPFAGLSVGGVRGKGPLTILRHLAGHLLAMPQALTLVRRFRPHVVLVAGGYVCVPVAVAAWVLGVPSVVMTVDIVPGWAIGLACRLASVVTVAFPEALRRMPRPLRGGKRVLTGYPLRPEFLTARREEARLTLGMASDEFLLVVFGGSQGARRINTALQDALPDLLPRMRVVHVGGRRDAAALQQRRQELTPEQRERYTLHSYLDAADLARALAAADLAVCRSGAGAMAELPAVGLPAVLVPGEFSGQDLNARYMSDRGAAVVVPNAALDGPTLTRAVLELADAPERRQALAAASRALARPHAAEEIARLVVNTATAHN